MAVKTQKFGTFLGVYLPSLLTILGLIMYLRFGWVVGNVGLGMTFLIVLLASSITFITGLSASAIATNIQVGVGGEYFLVSRSLGIEPGGAIGIPLYFCRTLSVTFYCFGLAEAILIFWPSNWGNIPSYALQSLTAILIIAVTLLSGKSASLTLKSQVPIMILVALSFAALFFGVISKEMHTPIMNSTYATAPEGFWYVFAVFFPAVTGFTAGIGMSGDLKNPRNSIPKGTLGAVLSGAVLYLIIPILFAVTAVLTLDQLTDPDFGLKSWTEVALFGSLFVIPAVWGALLSSAFGSILGGPRVLQALSMDGLAPKFFSKLSNTGQPTMATWVSGVIALIAVGLGELNTVAQFVSVLFLTLYVTINVSAAFEQLVAEPSYRPQIKVPWYISILGAFGAIWVMSLINPWACIGALSVVAALYIWLRSKSYEQQWGDVSVGFWANVARYSMLKLKDKKIHGRNWRPLMLCFVRDIDTRIQLIKLAESIGQNRGILTIANLHTSDTPLHPDERKELEIQMTNKLGKHGLQAFCEIHHAKDLHKGEIGVSKGHGLGDLRTNTIMFGWPDELEGQIRSIKTMKEIAKTGKNLIMARFESKLPKKLKSIDIWWGGQQNNGDLMLLLAFLIKLNREWEDAIIRILSVVNNKESKERLEQGILQLLPMTRIQAAVEIIQSRKSFTTILHEQSRKTDIVFLGLPHCLRGQEEETAKSMDKMSKGLKISVFVQNNGMSKSIPILLKV